MESSNTVERVDTAKWLRELGAVRPMAAACDEVLVLGNWSEGFYPIEWMRYRDTMTRDFNGNLMRTEPMELWKVFGCAVHGALTKEDCERILRGCK